MLKPARTRHHYSFGIRPILEFDSAGTKNKNVCYIIFYNCKSEARNQSDKIGLNPLGVGYWNLL